MSTARVALLIGFDRSGSSMAARLLAKHPGVNLLFQPFNRTEVHAAQWTPWPPEHRAPATERFLEGLLAGELDASYVASDWFWKHSSSHRVDPGRLNLVKDTKLHFQIGWLRARYPEIELVALERDPRAIVCSLLRNDFYRRWYGEASYRAVVELVDARDELAKFRRLARECDSDARRMALIVAVRSDALFRDVRPPERLRYEAILDDPARALAPLLARFGLEPFPFHEHLAEDFNIIGLPFERADLWRAFFAPAELEFLDRLFALVAANP